MKTILKTIAAAVVMGAAAAGAQAASAVLSTGILRMGVGDDGGLGKAGVGMTFAGSDAITPGCLCEGWGAAANGTKGYTYGASGTQGLLSANLTTTAASGAGLAAQSIVTMSNGLQVTHSYSYAAGGSLFQVHVDLKNTTGATLADVRYSRTLDWDVSPGYYDNNYTTIYGGTPTGPGGKVLHTSSNPFAEPDPLVFRSDDANANIVNSAGDKGSYFVFGFGALGAGEVTSFDTYIGASGTVNGLKAALGSVGVEAYSYTAGSAVADSGFAPVFGYGFAGLGLPPSLDVPEPGSLALVGLALVGAAGVRRRSTRA